MTGVILSAREQAESIEEYLANRSGALVLSCNGPLMRLALLQMGSG